MPKQTLNSPLFNESLADKQVIINLSKELYRRRLMPIVKTIDGKYYRVEAEQEVTAEDAQSELALLQSKVSELEAVLGTPANQDNNNGQNNTQATTNGQPGQPAGDAPADPGAAAANDQSQPAPGDQAAPASDPNNPTPPAASDPNSPDNSLTLQ